MKKDRADPNTKCHTESGEGHETGPLNATLRSWLTTSTAVPCWGWGHQGYRGGRRVKGARAPLRRLEEKKQREVGVCDFRGVLVYDDRSKGSP